MPRPSLYRVRLRVPMARVVEVRSRWGEAGQRRLLNEIATDLQRSGWSDVLSVAQDPTDNEKVTAVARWGGRGCPRGDVELVQEPPAATPSTRAVFDAGMSPDDLALVRVALEREDNPRHVAGVASSLAPFFPCSASLVHARATMLDGRTLAARSAVPQANADVARSVSRGARGAGLNEIDVLRSILRTEDPTAALERETEHLSNGAWPVAVQTWRRAVAPEQWASRTRLFAARDGLSELASGAKGFNRDAALALTLPEAWGAGSPVADRLRHLEFASSYTALPGANLTLKARGLLDDASATERLLGRAAFPREVQHLSVGRLASGAATWAKQANMPSEVLQDEVRRAAWTICSDPRSLSMRADPERSPLLDMPPAILRLAHALVRETGYGTWIVDRDLLLTACPPNGREGFVSPSAMQLALATAKPQAARVWNVSQVRARSDSLGDPSRTDPDTLRARNQIERAERALERRRWIEWYRRAIAEGQVRLTRATMGA